MGGLFDIPKKESRRKKLESIIHKEDFWTNQNNSISISKEFNKLEETINLFKKLKSDLDFCIENYEELKSNFEEINKLILNSEKNIEKLEYELYFNGDYDKLIVI